MWRAEDTKWFDESVHAGFAHKWLSLPSSWSFAQHVHTNWRERIRYAIICKHEKREIAVKPVSCAQTVIRSCPGPKFVPCQLSSSEVTKIKKINLFWKPSFDAKLCISGCDRTYKWIPRDTEDFFRSGLTRLGSDSFMPSMALRLFDADHQ